MTADQISKIELSWVRYAINEIYARYSMFYADDKSGAICKQLEQFDWFRPGDNYRKPSVESGFSKIEHEDLKSLKARRNELLNKPVDWKDDWEKDDN